ncbi:hypothetical protein JAAARDRAFT_74545, partial [Jaapia argillacea MUCL 33604]
MMDWMYSRSGRHSFRVFRVRRRVCCLITARKVVVWEQMPRMINLSNWETLKAEANVRPLSQDVDHIRRAWHYSLIHDTSPDE